MYRMPEYRPPRRHGAGTYLAAGGLIVALGAAAAIYGDIKGLWDLPFIEVPQIDLGSDPAQASAGVDQTSYVGEADLDIHCSKRVSAAVDVEAFKNGPVGDGVVKKKIFGDFLLCSDERELKAQTAQLTIDPITKAVTGGTFTLSGVYVEQPRIDMLDVRNCVKGRPGDSMDEINAMVKEYQEKAAQGDAPECDNGFDVTQITGSSDLSRALTIGNMAAQVALALDSNPMEIIAAEDAKLVEDVKSSIAANPRYSMADITVNVVRPDDTATVQDSINRLGLNAQSMTDPDTNQVAFSKVDIGHDDKGNYIYMETGSAGEHVTVHMTGFAELEVNDLQVNAGEPRNITEIAAAAPTTVAVGGN